MWPDSDQCHSSLYSMVEEKVMNGRIKVVLIFGLLLSSSSFFVSCIGCTGPGGPCSTGSGGGLSIGPGGGLSAGPGNNWRPVSTDSGFTLPRSLEDKVLRQYRRHRHH